MISEYQGDYAKAIFLWANAKKSPIKDSDDYPRYIPYECGIRNASDFHRKMVVEEYLKEDGFEAALESLKLPIMLCEKQLFEDIVNSIFDGTFNSQFYSAQLKVRYEKFIDII